MKENQTEVVIIKVNLGSNDVVVSKQPIDTLQPHQLREKAIDPKGLNNKPYFGRDW